MVGKDLPNGQTKVGDKVVNDVKLTNLPAGRFDGQLRPYSQADVERLRYAIMLMVLLMAATFSAQTVQITESSYNFGRGSLKIEHTLAQNGSRKLWELMHSEPYVHSLGALTGMQAMQMVKGGLKAIYCSGWQVAADANAAAQVSIAMLAALCDAGLLAFLFLHALQLVSDYFAADVVGVP